MNSPTGIAIIRRVMAKDEDGKRYRRFSLEHLERVVGKTYREIADTLKEIMQDKRLVEQIYDRHALQMHPRHPQLVVDFMATSRPVYSDFKQQGLRPRAVAVYGGKQTFSGNNGLTYLPRRDLMSGMQLSLQTGMLAIAKGLDFFGEFVREAENYGLKPVSPSQEFDAWRLGQYDDLLFAVAIACWLASQQAQSLYVMDPWSDDPPRRVLGPPAEVEVG
jgi:hypothetical protein